MILSKTTDVIPKDVGILSKPLSGRRKFMPFSLGLLASFEQPFPYRVNLFSIVALSGTVESLPPLFSTWIELED
jgi:hypothetical protein